jgi:hypothetical protein
VADPLGIPWDRLHDATARMDDARTRALVAEEARGAAEREGRAEDAARATAAAQAAGLDWLEADQERRRLTEEVGLTGYLLLKLAAEWSPDLVQRAIPRPRNGAGERLKYVEGLAADLAGCVELLSKDGLWLRQRVERLERENEELAAAVLELRHDLEEFRGTAGIGIRTGEACPG